jgi:trehalose/maltose transport system substrate-binding protein
MPRIGSLLAVCLALCATFIQPAEAKVTVAISCSSLGIEMELCRDGAQAWAKKTGNEVKLVSTPADAQERLALYQSLLASKSDKIDVFQIDVVWPGILANQFLDLNQFIAPDKLDGYFQTLVANNTVDGKLVAVPWFVDAGMLYYRKDLLDKYGLKAPETWADLETAAKKVMEGEKGIEGYVFQGRAYEAWSAMRWNGSSATAAAACWTMPARRPSTTRRRPRRSTAPRPGSAPSRRKACSAMTRSRRAAPSSPARRSSCATGPMPGRW